MAWSGVWIVVRRSPTSISAGSASSLQNTFPVRAKGETLEWVAV
jgi:hypothetical protein